MNKTSLIICVTLSGFVLASCKKKIEDECPKCPRVYSLIPASAHFNDTVLVLGEHLLPNPAYDDKLEVKFNGSIIPVEYIIHNTADSILLVIPLGAPSGPVTVDLNVIDGLIGTGSAMFSYLHTYTVSTFAGSGVCGIIDNPDPLLAEIAGSMWLAIDPITHEVYVRNTNTVRKISPITGVTTLITFSNGGESIGINASGKAYIANPLCAIKRLDFAGNWTLSLYAGIPGNCGHKDDPASTAKFTFIFDIKFDSDSNILVGDGSYLRMISQAGYVSTLTGSGSGFMDGALAAAKFSNIWALDLALSGDVFIADYDNHRIRKISGGMVSTVAGNGTKDYTNGPALNAHLHYPNGIAAGNFNKIYFTDAQHHSIRVLDLNTSEVSVFAGAAKGDEAYYLDGDLKAARFNRPTKLAYDKQLDILYIVDEGNCRIRMISLQ